MRTGLTIISGNVTSSLPTSDATMVRDGVILRVRDPLAASVRLEMARVSGDPPSCEGRGSRSGITGSVERFRGAFQVVCLEDEPGVQ